MVTTAAKPIIAPKLTEVRTSPEVSTNGSPNGAVTVERDTCPRCGAHLRKGYFEPECLQCGFQDYSRTPINGATKSLISSATRYILRYVGDFAALSNTVTHIKLHRVRNRVEYIVTCPFCARNMVQTSLSGKRREVREERYKCSDGHRVSLTPVRAGGLGWK